jgi:hypothetical protein
MGHVQGIIFLPLKKKEKIYMRSINNFFYSGYLIFL